MKEIPVGSHVCAIRQQIDGGKQITGILPQLIDPAGPTTVSELEPLVFHSSIYEFAEVEKRLIVGDPSVPGGFITMRYLPESSPGAPDPDWKCALEVVDGAAESVHVENGRITITLNTGVSTYASIFATAGADPFITGNFTGVLDGLGGVLAVAQPLRSFRAPPINVVEASDGGRFRVGEYPARIVGVHAECGAGSVITVSFADEDGSHSHALLTGVSGAADWHGLFATGAVMLPNQIFTVVETVSGVPAPAGTPKYLTLYVVNDARI